MDIVILILIVAGFTWFLLGRSKKKEQSDVFVATPKKWIAFLQRHVLFYNNLTTESKKRFERDVWMFLSETKITGVQTEVTLEDRLLVASSAVIPLFGFPAWNYSFLDEVLLYPSSFDRNYQLNNPNEIITGMVGEGAMEGKMILSKPSLHAGFQINNDKKNVGIHEFVHLFDKEDGTIDGIPPGFESKDSALPWLQLLHRKTKEIAANRSDIDDYGATNQQEFFAVAAEYFFERPHLLERKHPKLYAILAQVFRQDLANQSTTPISSEPREVGRNDPCPCGSGKKYKKCCLE